MFDQHQRSQCIDLVRLKGVFVLDLSRSFLGVENTWYSEGEMEVVVVLRKELLCVLSSGCDALFVCV